MVLARIHVDPVFLPIHFPEQLLGYRRRIINARRSRRGGIHGWVLRLIDEPAIRINLALLRLGQDGIGAAFQFQLLQLFGSTKSRAAQKGVVVVRASRVPTGYVGRNVEVNDDKLNFVAAEELNPPKARVLLRLALMKGKDPKEIQKLFNTY